MKAYTMTCYYYDSKSWDRLVVSAESAAEAKTKIRARYPDVDKIEHDPDDDEPCGIQDDFIQSIDGGNL